MDAETGALSNGIPVIMCDLKMGGIATALALLAGDPWVHVARKWETRTTFQ